MHNQRKVTKMMKKKKKPTEISYKNYSAFSVESKSENKEWRIIIGDVH